MSIGIFKVQNETLFNQLKTDKKLFTFEGFCPGIDKVPIGTEVMVTFGDKEIKVKVVKISLAHPSFKSFGKRVEVIAC
jgi:hypothetical protein